MNFKTTTIIGLLILLCSSTTLFAKQNQSDGFLELGLTTNKYSYGDSIENDGYTDVLGIELNYMNRIAKNIVSGFRTNYSFGTLNDSLGNEYDMKAIDANLIMKYELVNTKAMQFGPIVSLGWDYATIEDLEYNLIFSGVGVFANYNISKSISIGASYEYRFVLSDDISNGDEKLNINDVEETYFSIPLSLQMNKTTWLVLEYSNKSTTLDDSELNNNSFAAKLHWKW